MAVYLYNIDKLALLYYSDSVSHLVRARQLVDSSSPGIQQIGTVWLPLPHIMFLPFSLVDVLMKTGFAGTAVSLPSIAISAAIIYKIIKAQTEISWIAFLGACLYFSNPNILYLGLTAMTEALFMLFFVISAFYFQKCSSLCSLPSQGQGQVAFSSINQFNLTSVIKRRVIILTPLLKCSFFIALATLCRYEAWPIPIFLILFGFTHIAKRKAQDWNETLTFPIARMQLMSGIVLCTLVSFSGVILWISYNSVYLDNPAEFVVAPYYSAVSQAIEGENRESLFMQPMNVASIYGKTAMTFFGPAIIAGAILGYAVHRKSVQMEEVRRREFLYLFLAIPSITTFLALLFGLGEMNRWWFNSRFLIMLTPLLILLLSVLVKKIVYTPRRIKTELAYLITSIFLIYPIIIVPIYGEIVTFIDAKNSASYETRQPAMEMAEFLEELYDGGKILIVAGSAQQNIIMHASGIPFANFETAIEGSNMQYDVVHRPALDIRYVVLSKNPDASSQMYAESWTKSQNELKGFFAKIYENSHYLIFERSGLLG
jgi:hypothetical protein